MKWKFCILIRPSACFLYSTFVLELKDGCYSGLHFLGQQKEEGERTPIISANSLWITLPGNFLFAVIIHTHLERLGKVDRSCLQQPKGFVSKKERCYDY